LGSRNGTARSRVKATGGPVQLSRPRLRRITEAFASRLLGWHVTKTNALEALVIGLGRAWTARPGRRGRVREALGDQAAISKLHP